MLVEVRVAYNQEGLDALLQINDDHGLVRAKGPNEGSEKFWRERAEEYWTWMEEGHRTARGLLGILGYRVCYGNYYRILQGPDVASYRTMSLTASTRSYWPNMAQRSTGSSSERTG